MKTSDDRKGLAWQVSVWDRISQIYFREVDTRFAQVVEHVIKRAGLTAGQQVLDLGTGTGSVAIAAASLVGPGGRVLGVDVSHEMLVLAQRQTPTFDLVRDRVRRPAPTIPILTTAVLDFGIYDDLLIAGGHDA